MRGQIPIANRLLGGVMAEEQGAAGELRVRAWREHRKLSISELARRAGISRMTVVRIERGDDRAVRGTALERLTGALGATADELGREPGAAVPGGVQEAGEPAAS